MESDLSGGQQAVRLKARQGHYNILPYEQPPTTPGATPTFIKFFDNPAQFAVYALFYNILRTHEKPKITLNIKYEPSSAIMTSPVDILIIGGGPAGLSAASSIVRQAHSTLIVDSGKYRNANSPMHTVPTWDHRQPSEFRAAAKKDFERYGTVKVEDGEVTNIKKTDEGLFEAMGSDGQVWLSRKLVLATGVTDVFPDIPGYGDVGFLGCYFHCLYCHGWEERNSASSGILAEGEIASVMVALHLARQAVRLSKVTTIYTLGNEQLGKDLLAATESIPEMKVDSRKVEKLVKAPNGSEVTLHFEDGTTYAEGYLAHKPKFELRGSLAEQLGLELTPQGTIKVSPPFNQTSVSGVFAAGDAANPM